MPVIRYDMGDIGYKTKVTYNGNFMILTTFYIISYKFNNIPLKGKKFEALYLKGRAKDSFLLGRNYMLIFYMLNYNLFTF
jgi:hypothetical protein